MAPKRKAVTATTDLQGLRDLFKDYHRYPTEKRRNATAESIKQCLDQRLPIPPKVPFHQGAKKLRAEQERLDEEVDRIASLMASRGKHSAKRKAELRGDEENARKQAQLHSDENVIVSRHYQNYAWQEPSDDEDDEEEGGGEEEEEGGENGVNNGQAASEDVDMIADEEKSRKAMEETEAMRNMATAQVHEL